jgi:hypothetical protein
MASQLRACLAHSGTLEGFRLVIADETHLAVGEAQEAPPVLGDVDRGVVDMFPPI